MPREVSIVPTTANADDVQTRFLAGEPIRQIAKVVGLTRERVRAVLVERGIELRGRRQNLMPVEIIVAAYGRGDGISSIAASLGLKRGVVTTVLRRRGLLRSATEQNRIIAARKTPEEHRAGFAKARETRLLNLRTASEDAGAPFNPAVGRGYHETLELMERAGFVLERQKLFGPYYLDALTDDGIAVEVWYKQSLGFTVRTKRFEYLFDRLPIVYVVHTGVEAVVRNAENLLSVFEELRRSPPARGEYWVIRCHPDLGLSYLKDDKRAAIDRPKNAKAVRDWTYPR